MPYHVWDTHEIVLHAHNTYPNPYTDVEVWVDLHGPDFNARCYGFWDGGQTFRVRIVATTPGTWQWESGANPPDAGLAGQTGTFQAEAWAEADLEANPNRRGFLRPTANGRALEYADGTPFFLLGDTWWAASTDRYPWYDDDPPRAVGPAMGFKDMVHFRQAQEFNSVAILAAFPSWAEDGQPRVIELDDAARTALRQSWVHPGTGQARDMANAGGRPFEFPGKVPGYEYVFPDVERINPAYFQHLDCKIDYLTAHGFVPFIEVARRDISMAWRKFYPWPDSYVRYIQYVWSRYQASNCILSPIHFDWWGYSIHSRAYNEPANLVIERYGPPPFGNLVSANCNPSTLVNFGGPDECHWLTMHQIGNSREHNTYWYLTDIFYTDPPRPALNGEPYYSGFDMGGEYVKRAEGNTPEDDRYVRSGMYGSFLSGGLAGYIYGAEGIWGAETEPEANVKMWEALTWSSAHSVTHFKAFVFSAGARYRDLEPNAEWVSPSRSHDANSFEGWAYCARTPERDLFLIYFEHGCPSACLRGTIHNATYTARWFNPRTGEWSTPFELFANDREQIQLPVLPDDNDWALRIELNNQVS